MPTCADMSSYIYLPRSRQDNQINFATNCVKNNKRTCLQWNLLASSADHTFSRQVPLKTKQTNCFHFCCHITCHEKMCGGSQKGSIPRHVPEFKAALGKKYHTRETTAEFCNYNFSNQILKKKNVQHLFDKLFPGMHESYYSKSIVLQVNSASKTAWLGLSFLRTCSIFSDRFLYWSKHIDIYPFNTIIQLIFEILNIQYVKYNLAIFNPNSPTCKVYT